MLKIILSTSSPQVFVLLEAHQHMKKFEAFWIVEDRPWAALSLLIFDPVHCS